MNGLHLEMPIDRGLSWYLVHDDKRTIVSEAAATVLAGRHGVPIDGTDATLYGYAATKIRSFRLSEKARQMLAVVNIRPGGYVSKFKKPTHRADRRVR